MVGSTISHYLLLSQIGSGGMGVVYEAEDRKLGRRVALKFLSDNLCRDTHALQRFRREAYAASALSHPNICTVFDVDEENGRHFIALELLQGHSLREHARGTPLPVSEIVNIGIQVAEGLQAAHERGIVHRDISSGNVFICQRGQAKILDFGLAKLARPQQSAAAAGNGLTTVASSPSDSLTGPGVAVGTVVYMSPEQARGEELDARTDLFSLGAVLYEMTTGRVPFGGSTSAVIFDGILNRAPAPAKQLNPATPAELGRIIGKALEKDRDLRYQTAAELAADLKRLKRDSDSAGIASAPIAATNDDALPKTRRELTRTLLVLIQVMYVVFYIVALSSFWEHFAALESALNRSELSLVGLGALTALIGLPIRLYVIAAVGMDFKAFGKKFRLLFPFLLPLDWLWAFCPMLLVNKIGFGIAAAAAVGLMYLPFSQRTLVRMAYPYTSGSTSIRNLFRKSAH